MESLDIFFSVLPMERRSGFTRNRDNLPMHTHPLQKQFKLRESYPEVAPPVTVLLDLGNTPGLLSRFRTENIRYDQSGEAWFSVGPFVKSSEL
jgi:hypothetical protein